MTSSTAPRNLAGVNAERLAIADQLTFWRTRAEATSCPLRLASYKRILGLLADISERMEGAGNAT